MAPSPFHIFSANTYFSHIQSKICKRTHLAESKSLCAITFANILCAYLFCAHSITHTHTLIPGRKQGAVHHYLRTHSLRIPILCTYKHKYAHTHTWPKARRCAIAVKQTLSTYMFFAHTHTHTHTPGREQGAVCHCLSPARFQSLKLSLLTWQLRL